MTETYTQMKDRLYAERGPRCEVCTKYVPRGTIQVHHVIHRNVAPHMVMDEDNCVLICWVCHQRDNTGRLRSLLIRQRGQEWFDNLKAKVVV